MVACHAMAVVWKASRGETHYEVRSAGRTLRLYTNGAFHSQYHPGRLLPGGVWDLLALPSLVVAATPRSALVLGVGGGAVIHLLNRLIAPHHITGVELDAVHLTIARRFFGLQASNLELVQADAVQWVQGTRRRFHIVIDDLFHHAPAGDPVRPVAVETRWLTHLARRTGKRGMLIQNHLSPAAVHRLVKEHGALLQREFASALLLDRPHYENGVLVLLRERASAKRARRTAVRRIREMEAAAARQLDFRCRQLF